MYSQYFKLTDGNEEAVFEEFVCDVLSGMNTYGHSAINVNRIASVYGKDNVNNFVISQISKDNLKYIDNKKSAMACG